MLRKAMKFSSKQSCYYYQFPSRLRLSGSKSRIDLAKKCEVEEPRNEADFRSGYVVQNDLISINVALMITDRVQNKSVS